MKRKKGSSCDHINVPLRKQVILFLPVQRNTHYMMIFDAFVILICLASLILCFRSVIKGIQLQQVGGVVF